MGRTPSDVLSAFVSNKKTHELCSLTSLEKSSESSIRALCTDELFKVCSSDSSSYKKLGFVKFCTV